MIRYPIRVNPIPTVPQTLYRAVLVPFPRSSDLGLGCATNVRTEQPFYASLIILGLRIAGRAGMVLDQGTFRERPARRDEERRASMVRAASARRLRYPDPDPDPARPNA